MTKTMDIYFSDLNREAQHHLLKMVGVETPQEMNWDSDILPLFTYEVEIEEEE